MFGLEIFVAFLTHLVPSPHPVSPGARPLIHLRDSEGGTLKKYQLLTKPRYRDDAVI